MITPSILAEQLGWSRHKAYRKMREIHDAFPGVVERTAGRRLVAEPHKLAPHIRGMREAPLDREVRLLRGAVAELTARVDAEAEARVRFQSLAHRWFARVAAVERRR